jgi:hypothetical protein
MTMRRTHASLGAPSQAPLRTRYGRSMPSQQEWHEKLRDALNQRVRRGDVRVALSVEADPSFPFEEFDDEEFADWAEDWIGFTVASNAGPVMPGTGETEWIVGENEELRVKMLLAPRGGDEGPLVVD